ncbi:MAG: acyl-CoA dehydrogenase family protein [Pseudomonadota bacterium]
MISSSEKKRLLNIEPRFDDITCGLRAIQSQPGGIVKEAGKIAAISRKFANEVVRPAALELDLKMTEDHDHLPLAFVNKASEWGLYTLFLPKIFGGKGYTLSTVGIFIEEISSACIAMGNLLGFHYLGMTMLFSSWNLKIMNKIARDIVAGEKKGEPCLLCLAVTEPDAGTDSQNTEFMDFGTLRCHAKKVEGGYVINGTKIFISGGHLATWHLVHAYTDLDRASENTVMLAIKTGSEGFSFGKTEKKMGQKASITSELIFNNCFVPDENVCIDNQQAGALKRSIKETNEQIFAYIWGASRVAVGSIGVSAARGAFEHSLRFASSQKINGELMINHEWCQSMLADMYTNVAVARAACFEGMQANAMHGLPKILNLKFVYYLTKFLPTPLLVKVTGWFSETSFGTWLFRKLCFDFQTDEEIDRVDGWGSMAKVTGTDMGMKNCQIALELMGQAGVRHDQGAEKIFRDAKLLQIYEGTNQINRINIFKRLISRSNNDTHVFSTKNL